MATATTEVDGGTAGSNKGAAAFVDTPQVPEEKPASLPLSSSSSLTTATTPTASSSPSPSLSSVSVGTEGGDHASVIAKEDGVVKGVDATTQTEHEQQQQQQQHHHHHEPNALEDTQLRYTAYASRFAQLFRTKLRLVAYSSDIGESARPIVSQNVVRALYGVTFAYVATDVAIEGHSSWARGDESRDIARSMFGTFVFQSVASVLVPSAVIHTAVSQTQKAVNTRVKSDLVRRFAPVAVGLALIPALPLVDHPIESVLEKALDAAWPTAADAAAASAATAASASVAAEAASVVPAEGKQKME